MSTLRAKFRCTEVVKRCHWKPDGGFIFDAKFQAVTSGSTENERFFAATPSGQVTIGTIAADAFEPGRDYYLDFVPIEA